MKKYILTISSIILTIVLFYVVSGAQNSEAYSFGGYGYKNITSANASSTAGVVVKGGFGILSSITIASSSPLITSGFRIYDASTSATSTGTLIGKFNTSASEQTFPVDFVVTKGIVVDVPAGFNGSFIVGYQ